MAWLNATPKPDERTKRAKHGTSAQISRAERFKKDGITPQMPPNPAPHIIDRLVEIGLTEAAGMGAAPLSWQSIRSWSDMTGIYRSEEHTSELQSLMRISYAVFWLKKKQEDIQK